MPWPAPSPRIWPGRYYYATAAGTAVFAARAGVQGSLFEHNSTGWLAVTRIVMGYPLTIAAAGFGWFVVRRAPPTGRRGGARGTDVLSSAGTTLERANR